MGQAERIGWRFCNGKGVVKGGVKRGRLASPHHSQFGAKPTKSLTALSRRDPPDFGPLPLDPTKPTSHEQTPWQPTSKDMAETTHRRPPDLSTAPLWALTESGDHLFVDLPAIREDARAASGPIADAAVPRAGRTMCSVTS